MSYGLLIITKIKGLKQPMSYGLLIITKNKRYKANNVSWIINNHKNKKV